MLDLYLTVDTIAPFHVLSELVFTNDPKFRNYRLQYTDTAVT